MTEYIERETAEMAARNALGYKVNAANDVVREISQIPAADVAQVRNGKWILRGNKILCSCCKAVFAEVEDKDLFEVNADLPYLCEIEKFCFNCGCKMDGENNGSE